VATLFTTRASRSNSHLYKVRLPPARQPMQRCACSHHPVLIAPLSASETGSFSSCDECPDWPVFRDEIGDKGMNAISSEQDLQLLRREKGRIFERRRLISWSRHDRE